MCKRQLEITSAIVAVLLVTAYALYAHISIRSLGLYEIAAYVAYPEKFTKEEFIWVPKVRSTLLSELDSRSSTDLLRVLKEEGISPYFVISWANLDMDGHYDAERLQYLLRLLDILDSKGFDASFLSKDGCSAFHEAAIHKDDVAMDILKDRYHRDKIDGYTQAEIRECRQNLTIKQE